METWSIGSQRKKTNKTHADARKVITLFTLEPDYVISTTEFISSFRFVSNQSESFWDNQVRKPAELSGDKLSHTNLRDF